MRERSVKCIKRIEWTVDSESQGCGVHTRSRGKLGYALMILKRDNEVCDIQKRGEWKVDEER